MASFPAVIDLSNLGSDGFIILGDSPFDGAGFSVSSAGDVNGDGYDDIIVGAPWSDNGGFDAGKAYVIFGKPAGFATIDLAALAAADGFIIQGDAAGDNAGCNVSSAGDVNGDGYDDLIVGAYFGDDGGTDAGEAYVIFGKPAGFATVDLSALAPADGFVIQGDAAYDQAGQSVSSAGDVNGDGLDDLIVGARYNGDGLDDAGAAYVVFGKSSGFANIDLTTLIPADGFIIQGDDAGDEAGFSVSSAGDVNGDGYDDLIVGARYNDDGGDDAGAAYVIFGKSSGFANIDLATLVPADGFTIQGDFDNDSAGRSVSSAGDVNGDGYDDLIVGAPNGDDGGTDAGEAYVIFGKSAGFATVDLGALAAADGFIIQGDAAGDRAGLWVSSAGDVNGDGYDDLIVGAPFGADGGTDAGEAYVIFGKSEGFATVDLGALAAAVGFIIQGDAAGDGTGFGVSSAGDVNGDGYGDIIVGASLRDDSDNGAGAAYVIFGRGLPVNDAPSGADDTLTIDEDSTHVFAAADFGFSDPAEGDAFAAVLFATAPTNGKLFLDAVELTCPATVTVADLDLGELTFVPDANLEGAGAASVTFQVIDDGSGTSPNVNTDPTPNTLNFNITEINDVPELDLNGADPGTSNAVTFAENQAGTLLAPNSILTDPDAVNYENGTLTVEIVAGGTLDDNLIVPSEEGVLLVGDQVVGYASGGNGQPLVVTFTDQATVAIVEMVVKSIYFANYSDDPAEGVRTIEYVLTDGAGGTAATVTATVDVTAFEDVAVAFNDSVNTSEDLVLEGSVFAENGDGADFDPDGPPPVVVEVEGNPADVGSEILLDSGAKLTVNADGTFSYDPNHVFDRYISIEKAAATLVPYEVPTDTFTYSITGGATATVTVFIVPVDGPGDEIRGSGNNNFLFGTEVADLFVLSQGGNDIANGLGGDDVFVFGDTFNTSDSVDGGDGFDTILFEGNLFPNPVVLGGACLTNVERIVLGDGFSYTILTDDATVGAGAVLTVDGSGLGTSEALSFDGEFDTDGSFELIGGAGNDILVGANGNDVLVGGRGSDFFYGLGGIDRVDYRQATGTVVASLWSGNASHGAGDTDSLVGIENLTGSAFDDVLTGNGGANVLDGSGGADQLDGREGDDTYVVDNTGDQVFEIVPNGGYDTVRSSVGYTLGTDVERLILTDAAIGGTGNAANNILIGNAVGNILNGAGGADVMRGLGGDDTYYVDDVLDQVFEISPADGFDTIRSSVSYGLGAYQERLTLIGAAAIDGSGNSLDNVLLGNSAGNTLNGGQGADQMRGFGGDDTYIVDDAGDQVFEVSPADGADTVKSSVTFSLGSYLENLVLTGFAAIDGNGNTLVNNLTGNGGNNQLNGGAGADTMTGGAGDDIYIVDNIGDTVVETAGNGTDTVRSGVNYTLSASIENLTLTGSAVSGTGNGGANTINGNNAANALNGGANSDTLFGSFGTDTLDGGLGNDKLHGGASSDDLIGGAGFDSFYFDAPLTAVANVDDILDFVAADDTIRLDRAIFTGIGSDGAIGAAAFRLGTAALDADDRILYDSATGQIRYDADGTGSTAAILFATVTSGTTLTSADFFGF